MIWDRERMKASSIDAAKYMMLEDCEEDEGKREETGVGNGRAPWTRIAPDHQRAALLATIEDALCLLP
jgi:hypothetical protein